MSGERFPLGLVANRRLGPQTDFRFAAHLRWAPLNDTEYHMSAHHMALAVRVEGGVPVLGAVLDPAFLAQPPVDAAGRWRLGYQPIAIRAWPFALAEAPPTDRPVDAIEVLPGSTRITLEGPPICTDLANGALGPEMLAIRNTLLMLRNGAGRLSRALEMLRIANVLVPLRGEGPGEFLTVDAARFEALEPMALAALAAPSFLALDLAGAMLFSARHLDPKRLPLAGRANGPETAPETPATRADPMDFVLAGLQAMNFALDASDLFDPADPAIDWREFAPPPPPAELTPGARA